MTAKTQLLKRMRSHGTLLCVGLDPDYRKLPREVLETPGMIAKIIEYIRGEKKEEKVLTFLRAVVDVTGPHVCAYKVQKAFFDLYPGGHHLLQEIIRYVHNTCPGVPVIVDCKIGDIDNTMAAYTENLFDLIQADGIVVNPYMGDDVIAPLMERTDKAIVVLVKTSNVSGGIVQDVLLQDGRPLWQYMLDLVVNRWNRADNMIPVLSSTVGLDMSKIRQQIPDTMPILLAGVGAQGGNYDDLRKLLNSQGDGVFINSSRGILYPDSTLSWQLAIEAAAIATKNSINQARRAKS